MMRSMFVSLVVLVGMASASVQATHSLEKRQTAISTPDLSGIGNELSRLFNNGQPIDWALVGIAVAVFLAIDVAISIAVAAYLGVGGLGRARQDFGVGDFFTSFYNRIDIVESALDLMSVEEDACRHKAVCMAEKAAVSNSFAKLAINTINSNLSGLQRYRQAVEAGLAGQDCDLIYDQCRERVSFF